ncbi:MAG: hypothetical protein FWF92_03915 [Oscillospiraceae bacterium]|nr:hypothetical protein [Oscillospiraceae bacterium]
MKQDKIDSEQFDYKRIFNENIKSEIKNNIENKADKKEKRKLKEKKYIKVFLVQSIICLIIIGSIIITKYTNPKTFVSVSSVLNGIYENNITLFDLNKLIDEKIIGNDVLATFFNINSKSVLSDED